VRREKLESEIQRRIEAEIGAEPDLLLFKNSVGLARYVDGDGKEFRVPYGLGTGSPDLVGILAPWGRWFCLEVKVPGEEPRPEQVKSHAVWRRFGAYIRSVTSPEEARAALEDARADLRSAHHLETGSPRSSSPCHFTRPACTSGEAASVAPANRSASSSACSASTPVASQRRGAASPSTVTVQDHGGSGSDGSSSTTAGRKMATTTTPAGSPPSPSSSYSRTAITSGRIRREPIRSRAR
jgi:hypothetical protein